MRLQPLNRFGRWGVFQQPARSAPGASSSALYTLPTSFQRSGGPCSVFISDMKLRVEL